MHTVPRGPAARASMLACLALAAAGLLTACDDDPPAPATDLGRPDLALPDAFDPGDNCTPRPEVCNGVDDDCDELIDDEDPSMQQALFGDDENCGACGNACGAPQATVECLAGRCLITACEVGFNDQNGELEDGCESDCIISRGGREECDMVDNDCDGPVDEDFDLLTDVAHCGGCGRLCEPLPNGATVCVDGGCTLGPCDPGFIDLDEEPGNGCEYACVPNGDREFCNGIDDDCDGVIDEAADLERPDNFCGEQGGCAPECSGGGDCGPGERCNDGACVLMNGGPVGQACEVDADCTAEHPGYACVALSEDGPDGPVSVQRCVERQHPPICDGINGFRCLRGADWQGGNEIGLCDDFDNDCDGRVDEDYVDQLFVDGANRSVPRTCQAGEGLCQREEAFRCADDGDGTVCPVVAGEPPRPVDDDCNARDDDCDGLIDEDFQDIVIDLPGVQVYAYEASRPGATADAPGLDLNPDDGVDGFIESRACSQPGVLPWANITWADARAACAAAGARLCTGAEWQRACDGGAGRAYPYGNDYDARACNGGAYDTDPLAPGVQDAALVTGALLSCEVGGGYDLSGNLKEWVDTREGDLRAVRGGGFETNVPAGLTCGQDGDFKPAGFRSAAIGFRCCRDR